jgi:hypothetical protein
MFNIPSTNPPALLGSGAAPHSTHVSLVKTLPLYELPLGQIFLHTFTVKIPPVPTGSTSRHPSQAFELELLGAALELLGSALELLGGAAVLLLDPVKLHKYLVSPEGSLNSM